MKTQYYTASSLDGFLADSNHSLEWLFQWGDTPVGDYPGFIANVGAIAMGSNTYEWVLNHLARTGPAESWPYTQPSWVFTSRVLPSVEGADVRFVRGDVRPVHRQMVEAAGGKNVWIVGGGELAGQFHDHGLLDEIMVTFTSVTLAAGAPLLPRVITTPPLRLVSVEGFPPGFVHLVYEVPKGPG
jgi:dihydrofolate reductase